MLNANMKNAGEGWLMSFDYAIDKAVDACYGKKGFKSEPERLEFLFGLYQTYLVKESKGNKSKVSQ